MEEYEVLEIEKGEKTNVYDIEVEKNHNYFVNDILTHNTINVKRGRMVIPIMPDWSLEEIETQSLRRTTVIPISFKPNLDVEYRLLELDEKISEKGYGEVEVGNYDFEQNDFPPCVWSCLNEALESKELDHAKRVFLSSYLLQITHMDVAGLMSFYKNFNDYDQGITEYQLNWLKEHDYKPYACSKLQEMNLCPKRCSQYPYPLKDIMVSV